MDRKRKNNPDKFSYICCKVVLSNRQVKPTDFVKKAYRDCFGVKWGDQDEPFTPNVCCKTCAENLRDWRNDKRKSMPFSIPMVFRAGKDHITDCYFCMINLKGINRKNKHYIQYPDVSSAIKPIPHGPGLPGPGPDGNMEYGSDSEHSDMTGDDAYKPKEDDKPVPLTQAELNDLTRVWTFRRSLISCWVHISKRNICWHKEQRSTGIETVWENEDIFSLSAIINGLKAWWYGMEIFYWLIQRKFQNNSFA